MRSNGYLTANQETMLDLTHRQLQTYRDIENSRADEINNEWRESIQKYLEFRMPQLFDAFMINQDAMAEDLWIFPCILPPGKFNYLVQDGDSACLH